MTQSQLGQVGCLCFLNHFSHSVSVSADVQNEDRIKMWKTWDWEAYYSGSFHLRKRLWWIAQWRHRYTSILFKWPWEESPSMKQPQLRDYIYFPLKKTSLLASVSSLAGSSVSHWTLFLMKKWGWEKSRDLDMGMGDLEDYTAFENSITCSLTERADLSITCQTLGSSLDGSKDKHCWCF